MAVCSGIGLRIAVVVAEYKCISLGRNWVHFDAKGGQRGMAYASNFEIEQEEEYVVKYL